jgi:hypothetical protein
VRAACPPFPRPSLPEIPLCHACLGQPEIEGGNKPCQGLATEEELEQEGSAAAECLAQLRAHGVEQRERGSSEQPPTEALAGGGGNGGGGQLVIDVDAALEAVGATLERRQRQRVEALVKVLSCWPCS